MPDKMFQITTSSITDKVVHHFLYVITMNCGRPVVSLTSSIFIAVYQYIRCSRDMFSQCFHHFIYVHLKCWAFSLSQILLFVLYFIHYPVYNLFNLQFCLVFIHVTFLSVLYWFLMPSNLLFLSAQDIIQFFQLISVLLNFVKYSFRSSKLPEFSSYSILSSSSSTMSSITNFSHLGRVFFIQ